MMRVTILVPIDAGHTPFIQNKLYTIPPRLAYAKPFMISRIIPFFSIGFPHH